MSYNFFETALVLIKSPYNIRIRRWDIVSYSRAYDSLEAKLGVTGLITVTGPAWAYDRNLWTIKVKFPREVILDLLAMQETFRREADINLTTSPVLIYDYHKPVIEPPPRRRALAPNATEFTLPNGYISYYAQFNAVPFSFVDVGSANITELTMSFRETNLVLP